MNYFKYFYLIFFIFCTFFNSNSFAIVASNAQTHFTPPPIPVVNTPSFKHYVQRFHTLPSPFGFEPYRDKNGNPLTYLINELNPEEPYIPVTFYCHSRVSCPSAVGLSNDRIYFHYRDGEFIRLSGQFAQANVTVKLFVGFYFPNDPLFYRIPFLHPTGQLKMGDPIVTILFSQRALTLLSQYENDHLIGYLATNKKTAKNLIPIELPLSDGKENLTLGTTLSLLGLGQAAGVEFTETVSQTTGETYTKQVQTGFTLNLNLQNNMSLGGGVIPASDTLILGVNETLQTLVSNELSLANQSTMTRSFTIKPGVNQTYYWGIYQLLYSYQLNAPLLEEALKEAESIWDHLITFKIANNDVTQDGRPIGNTLPPQAAHAVPDVTVGVAVPVNQDAMKNKIYSRIY